MIQAARELPGRSYRVGIGIRSRGKQAEKLFGLSDRERSCCNFHPRIVKLPGEIRRVAALPGIITRTIVRKLPGRCVVLRVSSAESFFTLPIDIIYSMG